MDVCTYHLLIFRWNAKYAGRNQIEEENKCEKCNRDQDNETSSLIPTESSIPKNKVGSFIKNFTQLLIIT